MLERKTILSADRRYRYVLWREWGDDLFVNRTKAGYAMFVGLNPSTADEVEDDATIRVCRGFAKRWGYLAMCMVNLFALRATDPREMLSHAAPVGYENDEWIRKCAGPAAGVMIAAWGTHGGHLGRDCKIAAMLPNMMCFRKTKEGFPAHPLRQPRETVLVPWP